MHLTCSSCKREFSANEKIWRCTCKGVLDLEFDPEFPLHLIESRNNSMWRYREAIPIVDDKNIISFNEGFTPIVKADFNGQEVLLKQEQLFPSGSFKDRGASVLISKMKELRISKVIEDSSGNAGAAIAAYCARAGIECEIFAPATASEGKLTQIAYYGARLNKIPGTREDTSKAVLKAAEKYYYASHSWNPFFLHGTKTFAFEVCEQLGWQAPDTLILPVGNGTLLLGASLGFNELLTVGVIDRLPKIIAVQSINCAPLFTAFTQNMDEIPRITKKETLAEGIATAEPVRGKQILEAVRKSKGRFIAVNETEIKDSLLKMCRRGFYIEPTAAAATAGIEKYLVEATENESIASALTGNGLKATDKLLKLG